LEISPEREATGKSRQAKAKQVIDVIWDDDMLPLFEKTETFNQLVTDSAIKVILESCFLAVRYPVVDCDKICCIITLGSDSKLMGRYSGGHCGDVTSACFALSLGKRKCTQQAWR
jgi:hypothetical protein